MSTRDSQIVIFKTADERISVDVRFGEDTAWLTLDQMAALFDRDKSTVSRHINNVFSEGELDPTATVAKIATVQIGISTVCINPTWAVDALIYIWAHLLNVDSKVLKTRQGGKLK